MAKPEPEAALGGWDCLLPELEGGTDMPHSWPPVPAGTGVASHKAVSMVWTCIVPCRKDNGYLLYLHVDLCSCKVECRFKCPRSEQA